MNTVKFLVMPHGEGLQLPTFETVGSAGMDLRAAVSDDVQLAPLKRCLIPTGLRMELPQSYEAQVRPRSGLALKQGITVLNSPGTIDSDYRGEIGVILVNLSQEPYIIKRGDRIAQMVIARFEQLPIECVTKLDTTKRGDGGFGSTGQ